MMVGVWRGLGRAAESGEQRRESLQPWSGRWQLTQATVPDADQRLSQKNFLPSATFAGVIGLSSGICAASSWSPAGKVSLKSAAVDQPGCSRSATTSTTRALIAVSRSGPGGAHERLALL